MPDTKITDLLPIPPGVTKPNAYEIFGLEVAEQDMQVVSAGIRKVLLGLKEAKGSADPAVWTKAVKVAKKSESTLKDPAKKAELDARFGVITIPETSAPTADSNPPAAAPADPLGGVLPTADPLAGVLPANNASPFPQAQSAAPQTGFPTAQPAASQPTSPQTGFPPQQAPAAQTPVGQTPMPAGVFGTPQPAAEPAPSAAPVVQTAPVKIARAPVKRRRKSPVGAILFSLFVLGMFSLIGGLLYFLVLGPGGIAITQNEDGIRFEKSDLTEDPDDEIATARKPDAAGDGVMPDIDNQPRSGDENSIAASLQDVTPMPGMSQNGDMNSPPGMNGPNTMDEPDTMAGPDPFASDAVDPDPFGPADTEPSSDGMAPETMTPEPSQPEPNKPEPNKPEPTLEDIKAADAAIKAAADAITAANWTTMKSLAEAARSKAVTDTQKAYAESLYQSADLATYYRGGIDQAVAGLNVGNEVEMSPGLKVLVVENGPDLLVVRLGAKNYSYTFDKLPIKLAHSLAAYQVDVDTPTGQAALATYQAIVPGLNEGYRTQAIEQLQEISGQVEGADPKKIAEALSKLIQ